MEVEPSSSLTSIDATMAINATADLDMSNHNSYPYKNRNQWSKLSPTCRWEEYKNLKETHQALLRKRRMRVTGDQSCASMRIKCSRYKAMLKTSIVRARNIEAKAKRYHTGLLKRDIVISRLQRERDYWKHQRMVPRENRLIMHRETQCDMRWPPYKMRNNVHTQVGDNLNTFDVILQTDPICGIDASVQTDYLDEVTDLEILDLLDDIDLWNDTTVDM